MRKLTLTASLVLGLFGVSAQAEEMKMAVTTSFHNSGLSDVLLPAILEDTGIELQLLVVGTGQAIKLGEAGDVDAILVHSKAAEDAFVAAGHGTHRREIMYNDFVLVGPADDPAGIRSADAAAAALSAIAEAKAPFVSRGDDSGTHKKELNLWRAAGTDVTGGNDWYKEVGAGMGAALNTASGMGAYVLSDRASWLNFGNKGDLELLFAGDPVLFNQYAYLPVDPGKGDYIKSDLAEEVEAWLTSARAKELIDGYRIAGEQLFTFNAEMDGAQKAAE
ncbi:tungstate transport system substrate-binding protein [Roseovarius nanhaiticus]|uniref:Tungstate transport system substrate-binding protein n=1 Tax=Roseovarius nanhaiticus TaxID=573024 RepID=A0A1N7GBC1_9RHOB|nr:substrate-binding domain-containing protein [Roseovarius nanhaiticus]SEK31895.1 tungstate transport system substrate-binding protein [Roseovarius nanhaiticus]SIS09865.1 tungstate transport system substrate-binding protein [Roseovarius nanhaiticus]